MTAVEMHFEVRQPQPAWDDPTPRAVACGALAPRTCSTSDLAAVTCPECMESAKNGVPEMVAVWEEARVAALRSLRRRFIIRVTLYLLVIAACVGLIAWTWPVISL